MARLLPARLALCGVTGGDVLIETGSDGGYSLRHCVQMFQEIHTVEIDQRLHEVVKSRFKTQPKVRCHLGNSPDVLQRIIDPARQTVFWLDAHYVCEPGRVCHGPQCPLIDELRSIFSFQWRTSPVIIIDDARMFQEWFWRRGRRSAGYDKAQWPRQAEIESIAREHEFELRNVRGMIVIEKKGGE